MKKTQRINDITSLKAAIVITFLIMVLSWYQLNSFTPSFKILDPVPNQRAEKIKYLGDKNMVFRANSVGLQNAGDTFGRVTGLHEYDYSTVYEWLKFLEKNDKHSQFTPALAAYYFGATDKIADLAYVMQFLEGNYYIDPARKWWWLFLSVHIAKNKLHDLNEALRLANILAATPNERIPKWARQMPAFILEAQGELEEALAIIKYVADNYDDLEPHEINFMNYFIKDRLGFTEETLKQQTTEQK